MKFVLLIGASSVGKSRICANLKKNHGWHVTSFDAIVDELRREIEATLSRQLKEPELAQKLGKYMSPEEAEELSFRGNLTISRGAHQFKHGFKDDKYTGLDDVLKKEGFEEPELSELSSLLHSVSRLYLDYKGPNPEEFEERLFNSMFIAGLPDDACVVMDTIPGMNLAETTHILELFQKRAELYQDQHPDLQVEAITIMVYCPPEILNERILKRNQEAKINNNGDERGLFALTQLSALMESKTPAPDQASLGKVSNIGLMTIAYQQSLAGNKERWKNEGNALSKSFGLGAGKHSAELGLREGLKFDAIIDTSDATAEQLTAQVLNAKKSNTFTPKI